MLFGDAELFALARFAKEGRAQLHPGLAELRDWILQEFLVSVVHIVFDHIEIGAAAGRPRLNIILETDAEYESWQKDLFSIREEVHDKIMWRFSKIAARYPDLESDDCHLIADNFSDECLVQACAAFLRQDAKQVMRDFHPDIWEIDGFSRLLVVFLHTDKEVAAAESDGLGGRIRDACFHAVLQYDEFGYLTPESFHFRLDSKQNLDENYKGNLFNYWR